MAIKIQWNPRTNRTESDLNELIVGSDTTTKEIKESKFDADRKEVDRCKESGQTSRNEDVLLVSSHRLDDDSSRFVGLGDRD